MIGLPKVWRGKKNQHHVTYLHDLCNLPVNHIRYPCIWLFQSPPFDSMGRGVVTRLESLVPGSAHFLSPLYILLKVENTIVWNDQRVDFKASLKVRYVYFLSSLTKLFHWYWYWYWIACWKEIYLSRHSQRTTSSISIS